MEAAEHRGDRLAHRLVGAQHHLVVLVVVQSDRKALAQLTFGRLVFEPRGQPGPDQMQLGFLCGPHRYADHVTEGARGVGIWCDDVGIIVDA